MQRHTREAGWYWVRKKSWDDQWEVWVPAEWCPEFASWRSSGFSGIPDTEIQVGPRLLFDTTDESQNRKALEAERDEADRRAGAAERRLAHEVDARLRRADWLSKAKAAWGASDDCSFDVVWAEALKLKAQAEAQR